MVFNCPVQPIPANGSKERSLVWMAKAHVLSYVDRDKETLQAREKVTEPNTLFLKACQEKGFVTEKLGRSNEPVAA